MFKPRNLGFLGYLHVTTRVTSRLFYRLPAPRIIPSDSKLQWPTRKFATVPEPRLGASPDTIFALSTAPGKAAIAVIRISGPECRQIYDSLCPGRPFPKARHAVTRALYDPLRSPSDNGGGILDSQALVLYFPGPRSATGEDVLELHVHGGTAIVQAVLNAIPRCGASIRYADPGEFTRRAFFNDRLSLPQVESLADTLSAVTEQQRKLSVRGAAATLTKTYEEWRHLLLLARGEMEALIDFSEDQHFDESPAELVKSVAEQVEKLLQMIDIYSNNAVRGELLRNGIELALLGAPNAGKSSLLNSIVGRDAAIVSQEAGTTRDVVEVGIDISGFFVRLADTAGLRVGDARGVGPGAIEQEGMRRAKQRAADAAVVVAVLSFEKDAAGDVSLLIDPEVAETALLAQNLVVVINKMDLLPDQALSETHRDKIREAFPGMAEDRVFSISCLQAETVAPFVASLSGIFKEMTSPLSAVDHGLDTTPSLSTTTRQRLLLEECAAHLRKFSREAAGETDIVLLAEHLRAAAACLSKVTGLGESGDVEQVLGVVFEKFCVGK